MQIAFLVWSRALGSGRQGVSKDSKDELRSDCGYWIFATIKKEINNIGTSGICIRFFGLQLQCIVIETNYSMHYNLKPAAVGRFFCKPKSRTKFIKGDDFGISFFKSAKLKNKIKSDFCLK